MKLNYILIPLITVSVAFVGEQLASFGLAKWYKTLKLPKITPPGSTIAKVWTAIFIFAAISALMVWNSKMTAPDDLIFIGFMFVINAVMNVFWSFLFFYAHMLGYAVIEAAALAMTVLALILYIYPISFLAALLLVPYLLWTSFAAYLTYSIWTLNKQ